MKQVLLLIFVNQTASALFRFIASAGRNMIVANTFGLFTLVMLFALGGFVQKKMKMRKMVLLPVASKLQVRLEPYP